MECPYGSWPTPIDSELVVAASVRLSEVRVDGSAVVWSEGRPAEGGRTQLVRLAEDDTTTDLLPDGYDARTAVHEYGGAAWWVRDSVTWFVNWADQRLYRLAPGGTPQPLTPAPDVPRGDRYADGDLSRDGATIVCIREHHVEDGGPAQVRNEIVQLAAAAPSQSGESGILPGRVGDSPGLSEPVVLVSGPDFVAAPRLSPDGATLAYLRWDHPSMPWDATELVTVRDGSETVVAGGPAESVLEPRWTADGALWFLSDRTGWWNLYRLAAPGGDVEAMVTLDAEIGQPAWLLGSARYAVLTDGRVVFARQSDGYDTLAVRDSGGTVRALDLPFSTYTAVRAAGPSTVVVVAGSPTSEPSVTAVTLDGAALGSVRVLRAPRSLGLDAGYLSVPEHVTFPSPAPDGSGLDDSGLDGSGRTAHALYYPPANPTCRARDGELPPLLVVIHGGPTGSATPVLALGLQYWTSRGFAVVSVNYGGSTGYGRAYREQLLGNWGVLDVADCLAAANWLASTGRADPARMCIRGGSAGGYTTLAALVRADTPFAAGADYYGVSDLAALAAETHKFESRYLDRLVGPYPQAREVYVERSPISHVAELDRPLIVLQGSEDAVVPPKQSEVIVDALRLAGVPVAYLLFDGEQHGFRRAENIRRAMDAEFSFYAQVLGFPLPADEHIAPVVIENLPS
jgi:dipeptidyl aminopeptidase/acylaminoacyl peptidase